MMLNMFKSKIHRATVTQADLDYEGSVSIDEELLELSNILPHESVHIWNVTRGTRLTTYALKAKRGGREICINGAAAHLMKPGDTVIIATFCQMDSKAAQEHEPTVLLVDEQNNPKSIRAEIPGPNTPRL
jgi:aspartate 1-decarboxylase